MSHKDFITFRCNGNTSLLGNQKGWESIHLGKS